MSSYRILNKKIFKHLNYSLKTIQQEDIELIRQWRNDQMDFLRQKEIIEPKEQVKYFSENIWPYLDSKNPSNILLGFYFKNILIGYGGFVHISWEDKRAEISFLLDPKRMKDQQTYKNDFSNYLYLIKEIAHQELNFNKIYSETYSFRKEHIVILEDSGFNLEGVLREHIVLEGIPIDSILHGLLLKTNVVKSI